MKAWKREKKEGGRGWREAKEKYDHYPSMDLMTCWMDVDGDTNSEGKGRSFRGGDINPERRGRGTTTSGAAEQ